MSIILYTTHPCMLNMILFAPISLDNNREHIATNRNSRGEGGGAGEAAGGNTANDWRQYNAIVSPYSSSSSRNNATTTNEPPPPPPLPSLPTAASTKTLDLIAKTNRSPSRCCVGISVLIRGARSRSLPATDVFFSWSWSWSSEQVQATVLVHAQPSWWQELAGSPRARGRWRWIAKRGCTYVWILLRRCGTEACLSSWMRKGSFSWLRSLTGLNLYHIHRFAPT